MLADGETVEVTGDGLRFAARIARRQGAAGDADPARRRDPARRATTRAAGRSPSCRRPRRRSSRCGPRDGAILALVGGFDFDRNKFNHVTQAQRQPGLGFKPFIYSAALEKGFTPATVVNDAPFFVPARQGRRRGLGAQELRRQVRRPDARAHGARQVEEPRHRPRAAGDRPAVRAGLHRPLRLRSEAAPAVPDDGRSAPGSATPLQMAAAYAVFANGGYRVAPYLIARIVDARGNVLSEAKPDGRRRRTPSARSTRATRS